MYEFQHDYEKSKYVEKENLCYMDTDSFIAYLKTDDIYKDIGEDVENYLEKNETHLASLKKTINSS